MKGSLAFGVLCLLPCVGCFHSFGALGHDGASGGDAASDAGVGGDAEPDLDSHGEGGTGDGGTGFGGTDGLGGETGDASVSTDGGDSGGRGGGGGSSGSGGSTGNAGAAGGAGSAGGVGAAGSDASAGATDAAVTDGNGDSKDGEVGDSPEAGACAAIGGWVGDPGDFSRALWPIPNAADAGLPSPQSYTVMSVQGGDVVLDKVTGLTWQRSVPVDTYDAHQAATYCDTLPLGALTGWRIPSLIELVSILDYGHTGPAIDSTAFPNALPPQPGPHVFWSSTLATPYAGSLPWTVDFGFGQTQGFSSATDKQLVRCVRSETAATPACRYMLGNGTVQDTKTRLIWQQGRAPVTQTWAEAQMYCTTATVSGVGGWRLPSINELLTLLDLTRNRPAIDLTVFPGDTPNETFWSSTALAGPPGSAWNVRFDFGSADISLPTSSKAEVRCVR